MGEVMEWANAVGLVLTWLPEPYWLVLHDRIVELLQVCVVFCVNVIRVVILK